ncbi:MAG: hypothetical protein WBV39_08325 [Rudaea sp.]
MTQDFQDIEIVDLDLAKTTWSRVHSSMRTLYLRLTREPDMDWARFFHAERESRIVLKRHGLWIEDGYIVFDCRLEDVETVHLPDFRLSVAYANVKCRELAQINREQGEQHREDVRSERDALVALRARIRGEENIVAAPSADTATDMDDFNARREQWRARFRAAMTQTNQNGGRSNGK